MKLFSLLLLELTQSWRRKQDYLLYGFFFLMIPFLFQFAFMQNAAEINTLYYLWISFILTHFLSCQNQLTHFFMNNYFEQILLSRFSFLAYIGMFITSRWVMKSILLSLMLPFFYIAFQQDFSSVVIVLALIWVTSLYFELIGFVGSVLTEQTQQSSILFVLIMLPFYIPGFLFGLMGVQSLVLGLSPTPYLAMISGIDLLFCLFIPYISKHMIKMRLSQ